MADVLVSQKDNNRSIELPLGSRIKIDLPENPTTGYRWSLREFQRGPLICESDDYSPAQPASVGGGGIRHFAFLATGTGTATIELSNRREWEQETAAEMDFTLSVTVT